MINPKDMVLSFHIASGTKLVSYIGLFVTALGLACTQLDPMWFEGADWAKKVCSLSVFAGSFLAAMGKGIGDRRATPERDPNA